MADRFKDVKFTAAYSSDLQRSSRTAEIIVADAGVPLQTDIRLREIDAGLWEGLTSEEAEEKFPEDYAQRETDIAGFRFTGGQSYRDLSDEVLPVFGNIVDTVAGDVLVVAHKGVNRVVLGHYLDLPLEEVFSIPQDYGCVNILRVTLQPDGGRQVEVSTPQREQPEQ